MKQSGYLSVAILIVVCFWQGIHAQQAINKVNVNVGETATIPCRYSNTIWFKNGTKVPESHKVKVSGPLIVFCVEVTDDGIYECKNKDDVNQPTVYFELIVNNPDNREIFHIYNENHKKCLSRFFTQTVHVEECNLHSCTQKWMWTADHKLVNMNDLSDPRCLSTSLPPTDGNIVRMENCSKPQALRWECINDLLRVQDSDLNLNHGNNGLNVNIFKLFGPWSHWVKYTTGDNLCTSIRRAVVTPEHIVTTDRTTVKVICQGINFIKPTYTWLKNGKHLNPSSSGLSLHLHSHIMLLPYAYTFSSGNYTCVVTDEYGRVTASTIVEIYEDPTVISHSLNQQVLLGSDVCLSCEMFANTTTPEVTWLKMGVPVLSDVSKFIINIKSPGKFRKFSTELCIKSLNTGDNGVYSCEIKHAAKRASAEGKVQVLMKPEVYISKIEDNYLVCNASGFPPPRLIWYIDNKHFMDNNVNNDTSLTITESGSNLTCVASNLAGTTSKSFSPVNTAKSTSKGTSLTYVIVGCVVGGVLLLLIVIIVCCYCRRKKEVLNNNDEGVYHTVRYTQTPGQASQSEYTTVDVALPKQRIEFHPRSSTDPSPKHFGLKAKYQSLKPRVKGEWEVPYECVKLNKKLGEGQFGQVWKGDILARKGSRTVAVKMLRAEDASALARKALIDELEFMKTMSPHPNIVGLVGCCTRAEDIMIIVEYVPGGNLKDYLLFSRSSNKDTYANLAPFSATLTSKDLLTFGYEIARGMSYLEQIKCVHRDLAARNILVGDDKTCKIADFGLARDIYSENYYRKTNGGRLPLRWMAYESIFNGITTSQSDAWSFGVVLWEIVTLGGNPYPDMNRDQVIDGLQRGYRMPKPHHCSEEVYAVMWECWQQNPDKRPSFAELTATFLRLISLQQIFINMQDFGEDDYVNVGSYEETGDN